MKLMKDLLHKFGLISLTGLALAGCATDEADSSEKASGEGSSNQALVVYTNSLDDEKETWLQEQSEDAGYDVSFVRGGGGEIFNRVIAEAGDPQADVLIGMDEGQFSQIQEEDLLVEWEPEWASDIPAELLQGGSYYYPWSEQRIFSYANEGTDVPESLEAVITDSSMADAFSVPSELGGSTNQKIVFSVLLQYLDEEGELGVSDEGWDMVTQMFENGYIPSEGDNTAALLADGTLSANYGFSGAIPNLEEEFGFAAQPIDPEYGVFTMAEQVGIVNKGDDHDHTLAEEYAEWWGSPEIQEQWVEDFGTVPSLESIQDAVNPRVAELFEQTSRMNVDWDIVNEYANQWVEKIELDIMPAG